MFALLHIIRIGRVHNFWITSYDEDPWCSAVHFEACLEISRPSQKNVLEID